MTSFIFKKQSKAFTIMEIIVVLAVFSTTTILAIDLFMTVNNLQRKTSAIQRVQSDIRYALEFMAREVKNGTIDYEYYKHVCIGGDNEGASCPGGDDDCINGGSCVVINLTQPTRFLATRDQDNTQIIFQNYHNEGEDRWILKVCSNPPSDPERCWGLGNFQDVTPSYLEVTKLDFYISPTSDPFLEPPQSQDDCEESGIYDSGAGVCQCSSNNDCFLDQKCQDVGVGKICLNPDFQPKATIFMKVRHIGVRPEEQEEISLQTTVSSRIYKR